jgi:hypothetical protein
LTVFDRDLTCAIAYRRSEFSPIWQHLLRKSYELIFGFHRSAPALTHVSCGIARLEFAHRGFRNG